MGKQKRITHSALDHANMRANLEIQKRVKGKALRQRLQILDEISNIDVDVILRIIEKWLKDAKKTRDGSLSKKMKVTCCPVWEILLDELIEETKTVNRENSK